MLQIFIKFFTLGWISFGGPAAHIGYFRQFFVEQEKWLSDKQYTQFVALSQLLPGPGSSQVGFSIGYQRAGLAGGVAAFLGFTLPSIVLMIIVATVSSHLMDNSFWQGAVAGLKLFAVIIVIDATWGMFNSFCKSKLTVSLAVVSALLLLLFPSFMMQILVLFFGALLGKYCLAPPVDSTGPCIKNASQFSKFKLLNWPVLLVYLCLLLLLPLLSHLSAALSLFSDFYQAGSMVFGGGHVVLPLLQNIVGDQMSADAFLTGYASAQAVPGPMFTLATFLGFEIHTQAPIIGALIATLAIFLPGFLLIMVVLKNWQRLADTPALSGALNGVNATVVGLLLATLYQPVFQSAVHNSVDMGVVVLGVYLLKCIKLPIMAMVLLYITIGVLLTVMGA